MSCRFTLDLGKMDKHIMNSNSIRLQTDLMPTGCEVVADNHYHAHFCERSPHCRRQQPLQTCHTSWCSRCHCLQPWSWSARLCSSHHRCTGRGCQGCTGSCSRLLEGGVCGGTDVFEALALGASGVFASKNDTGRPVVFALAAEGEAGVRNALQMLRDEFELTMALSGCTSEELAAVAW
ncbi:unnamed protein product [Musa acuminata subsp. malaccensis]|nr:unnamed protein product [Musa acuminata subsp. malaccensis]